MAQFLDGYSWFKHGNFTYLLHKRIMYLFTCSFSIILFKQNSSRTKTLVFLTDRWNWIPLTTKSRTLFHIQNPTVNWKVITNESNFFTEIISKFSRCNYCDCEKFNAKCPLPMIKKEKKHNVYCEWLSLIRQGRLVCHFWLRTDYFWKLLLLNSFYIELKTACC